MCTNNIEAEFNEIKVRDGWNSVYMVSKLFYIIAASMHIVQHTIFFLYILICAASIYTHTAFKQETHIFLEMALGHVEYLWSELIDFYFGAFNAVCLKFRNNKKKYIYN